MKATSPSFRQRRALVHIFGLVLLPALIAASGVKTSEAMQTRSRKLVPHHISLASGRSFDLNLPEGFGMSVAAQGLKRVRFMAESPDGRIFVTDMYNLADNKRGVVYILDEFDPASNSFNKVTPYLSPVDVLSFGKNAFLLTDDNAGVVYYVYEK